MMSKDTEVDELFNFNLSTSNKLVYIGDPAGSEEGDIGPKTSAEAIKALLLLDSRKSADNTITVILNSSGGSVSDGLAIHDAIVACKNFVHVHVMGECCSIAMAILQAGDRRTASPHSWLMVHDGQASDGKIDTRDVDALKFITDRQKEQYYAILAEKSKLSAKEWAEKCRTDFWMTAQDALDLGVIDEIV